MTSPSKKAVKMKCSCGAVLELPLSDTSQLLPATEAAIDKFIREHASHGIKVGSEEHEEGKRQKEQARHKRYFKPSPAIS